MIKRFLLVLFLFFTIILSTIYVSTITTAEAKEIIPEAPSVIQLPVNYFSIKKYTGNERLDSLPIKRIVIGTTIDEKIQEEEEATPALSFTDEEINYITNMVRGESGGIIGTATITYANGTSVIVDACILHQWHAAIVKNMVNSSTFPSTVKKCINQCFSSTYTYSSNYRTDSQWQHCRNDVVNALTYDTGLPSNVYAATCDPYFAQYYPGWYLFARVDWNTGWYSGTFYYYQYNG